MENKKENFKETRVKKMATSLPHLSSITITHIDIKEFTSITEINIPVPEFKNMGDEAMTMIMSAFYAKMLIVMGVALPVTDAIRGVSPGSYEAFYVYLYVISSVFLAYLYATYVREKTLNDSWRDVRKNSISGRNQESRFGSSYLHMGVAVFGIGSIIYSSLQFGRYFELTEECDDFMMAFTPLAKIIFMIQQILFVFSWSNMVDIKKYAVVIRFGLMHMIATNICIWLSVIIEETKYDIFNSTYKKHLKEVVENGTSTAIINTQQFITSSNANKLTHYKLHSLLMEYKDETNDCYSSNIMGPLLRKANPYLSPCDVEYSLLCAIILVIMWKNVDAAVTVRQFTPGFIGDDSSNPSHSSSQFSVDCAKAQKGLFLGVSFLGATVISLVMFLELVNIPKHVEVAVLQVNIWETILFATATVTAVACIVIIRSIGFKKTQPNLDLEHVLLLLTQSGVYIYSLFQVIGCCFLTLEQSGRSRLMRVIAPSCAVIQSSCQTLLILEAWRRRCISERQRKMKPGRQLITFLLAANMSLWIINRVKNNRAEFHPFQMEFYGVWAWTIITHVSMPLVVCYRFQSIICFYEIWKYMYKPLKNKNKQEFTF